MLLLSTPLTLLALALASLATASIPPPDTSGKYTITAPGIKAQFVPYGGAISNLFISDRNGIQRDIVLGYDNASYYITDPNHPDYGAIPGRYFSRIANATFTLDGQTYYTERNAGNSTLHSGKNGWSWRSWNVSAYCEDSITFTMRDESFSSEGMPGLVLGSVTYEVKEKQLDIYINATAPEHNTPVMLTNHAYWNLDAFANPETDTILDHTFSMPFAKRMMETNAQADVTGKILDVEQGDIYDFWSEGKKIGECWAERNFTGFDNQWILDGDEGDLRLPVASLSSDFTGIKWDMYTNQAALVMYTSNGFEGNPLKSDQTGPASDGHVHPHGAVSVEASDWEDGINHPEWGRLEHQIRGPTMEPFESFITYKFSLV